MIDKNFCMSSFLMYRYLFDETKNFGLPHKNIDINFERTPISSGGGIIRIFKYAG